MGAASMRHTDLAAAGSGQRHILDAQHMRRITHLIKHQSSRHIGRSEVRDYLFIAFHPMRSNAASESH